VSPTRDSGLPARARQPKWAPCVIPLPGILGILRVPGRYVSTIVIVLVLVLAITRPPEQVTEVLYALATVLALAEMREKLA
jgi:hypothetical protein